MSEGTLGRDGKKRKSGNQYRKEREEKKLKEESVLNKTKKIESYFTSTSSLKTLSSEPANTTGNYLSTYNGCYIFLKIFDSKQSLLVILYSLNKLYATLFLFFVFPRL